MKLRLTVAVIVFGAVFPMLVAWQWVPGTLAQTPRVIIGVRFGPGTQPCKANPLADCSSPNRDASLKIYLGQGPEWGFVDQYGRIVHSGLRNVLSFADGVAWGYVHRGRLVQGLCAEEFGGPLVRPCTKPQTDAMGWALLDDTGKVRRPHTTFTATTTDDWRMLSDVAPFSEGLAPVNFGSLTEPSFSYVDGAGAVRIRGSYADAGPFSEGRAPVRFADGRWTFIDRNGKHNGYAYGRAGPYSQGMAPVSVPKGWTFAIADGRLFASVYFTEVLAFSDGLASVRVGGEEDTDTNHIPPSGGLWGFVDRSGTLRIPAKYSSARAFREGFAAVCAGKGREYRCGTVDANGATRIPFVFTSSLSPFYGGWAIARTDANKAFFVDWDGRPLRLPNSTQRLEFDDARVFVDGIAAVRIGKLWGFIDQTGRFTAPPQFLEVARDWPEGRGPADDIRWMKSWYVED